MNLAELSRFFPMINGTLGMFLLFQEAIKKNPIPMHLPSQQESLELLLATILSHIWVNQAASS